MQYKSKILVIILLLFSNHSIASSFNSNLDSLINNFPSGDSVLLQLKPNIDSIMTEANNSGDDELKSKAFLTRGLYHYNKREYSKSLWDFKKAYNYLKKSSNLKLLANIEYNLAKSYNRLNRRDSAIIFFKKSAANYKKAGDINKYGLQLNNTGLMFWIGTQYDSAIAYYQKALEVRKRIGDKDQLSTTLNNMGTIYYQWGAYSRAFEYYIQAMDYAKQLNNLRALSLYHTNIGLVYKDLGNFAEAKEYFINAIKYAEKANDIEAFGYAHNSLGDLFIEDKPDSAIEHFNLALSKYTDIDFISGSIIAYVGLGKAYLEKGEIDKAQKYFQMVLDESKRRDILLRIAEAYKYLGVVEEKKGNYSQAEKYYRRCIQLSKERSLKPFLRDAHKLLSELKAKQGNYPQAYEELQNYLTVRDMIENEAEGQKFRDLESRLKFEEYRNEIERERLLSEKRQQYINTLIIFVSIILVFVLALIRLNRKLRTTNKELREKNQLVIEQSSELEKKNEELKTLNKTKEKFFSIIAHDLKNPFFGLINYTDMLLKNFNTFTEEEVKEILKNTNNLAKNTFQLLENLLYLSSVRTGKIEYAPENCKINSLVNDSLNLYKQQIEEKEIKVNVNASQEHFAFVDKNMISLVIRNLIHNAIKFVNKKGTIKITIFEDDNKVCTAIQDNGIGMDKETLEQLFSPAGTKSNRGTSGEKGTGLGVLLCKEFVTINKGEIRVDSELGVGTKFVVCLPKSEVNSQ